MYEYVCKSRHAQCIAIFIICCAKSVAIQSALHQAISAMMNPFDQDRHKQCIFDIPSRFNQPYYEAFVFGCIEAGNTEETCERNID